jgi:hypothetical protein
MFGLFMNSLVKYKLISTSDFLLIARMKHSHVIYDALTKSLIVDNSLKKELELAKKRKLLNAKIKYKSINEIVNSINTIEMSESHDAKPYIKFKNK